MSEQVDVTTVDGIVEISLNRPEKKNAITSDMYAVMADAIEQAESDPESRVVILRSQGDSFSAGNDLQDFLTNPPAADSPVIRYLRALSTTQTPVVAAVQGKAVGVGATTLLHCDYVVAGDDATLHFPFVNLALIPEAASSLLLPRVIGYLRAAELLLTGGTLPAARALELGLVSRVVPAGGQLDDARAFAARLAKQPPEAVRQTKRLLKDDTPGVAARIEVEGEAFSERLRSPEFQEAVQAFLEKREPNFAALARA